MSDSTDKNRTATSPAVSAVLASIAQHLSTPSRQFLAATIALMLAVLAAYSNLFATALQSDERVLIETSLGGEAGRELPIVAALDIGVEARLFGLNPLGFRVLAIALHGLAAFAAYSIARRLAPDGLYGWLAAVAAAAVFAAHPATTHAVNTLSARSELLGSTLALSGVALLLSSVAVDGGVRWRRASCSWALIAVACASSPAASLVAPMLPALEYASRRRVTWYLQIPAIAGVILVGFVRTLSTAVSPEFGVNDVATHTLASLKLLGYPLQLLVYHAHTDSSGIVAWLVVLGIGLISYALLPSLGASVLWFALAVRFAHYGEGATSFDEATMHIVTASLAWIVVFVLSFPRARTVRVVAGASVAFAILGAIALTSTRNNTWRSEAALWLQAYEACPDCAVPPERLSRLHYEQAMRELNQSPSAQTAALAPDVPEHLELAVELSRIADGTQPSTADRALRRVQALRLLGRTDESATELMDAVARHPADARLVATRADAAFDDQALTRDAAQRAIWDYRSTLKLGKLTPASQLRYAHACARIGNWRDALTIVWGPDITGGAESALAEEAAARLQSTRTAQSAYAQAAQRVSPADRAAIVATILVGQGHVQLADQIAGGVVSRYTGSARAWMAAALAHWHMDRMDDFIGEGVPANVSADTNAAWNGLVDYFVRSGEPVAAERVLRRALDVAEFDSCMRVAELAREAQRPNVATVYLRRAAGLDLENPAPWLRLADLALAEQQPDAAREAIENAEQRGADAETLNRLKSQAGIAETTTQGLRRTIIR